MIREVCALCGSAGTVVISTMEHSRPVSHRYCDACWRIVRYEAGPIMTEGPAVWGEDWSEVEEWIAHNLRIAKERPQSHLWRRLLAHDVRQQLSHLPREIPPAVSEFLSEFGDGAG